MVLAGNFAIKTSMSLRAVSVPVGLLGLHMYTRPVDASARASVALRSCSYILLSGTLTTSTPGRAYSPSKGHVGDAWTSFFPGPRNAAAAVRNISDDPHPRTICSGLTRWRAAILLSKRSCSVPGYRWLPDRASRMATRAFSDGP